MVSTAGKYPCACADLEVGHRYPQSRSHGEFGQRFGLDALYIIHNKTETVAHVDDSGGDAVAGLRGKHKASGKSLAYAYAEEVNLKTGLLFGDKRAHFKHMGLKYRALVHGRPTIISMSKYELEKKFKRIV